MAVRRDLPHPMTAEAFEHVPDEDMRHELVRGVVLARPWGDWWGSAVGTRLAVTVFEHCEATGAGVGISANCGFVLQSDPDTVRAPSFAVILKDRLRGVPLPRGFFQGAPDLAGIVVSSSDGAEDLQNKIMDYLGAGTRLLWVVYPETRQVVEYRQGPSVAIVGEDGLLNGDPVLQGLVVPASDIFSESLDQ